MALELKGKIDMSTFTTFFPSAIKTYHKQSYDRLSPSKTTFAAEGKTVFITAGATGIGYAICESFAAAGVAQIVIIQRREEVLAKAKQALESKYPKTKITTYAASANDRKRMTEILQEVGHIDVLVPCAAAGNADVPAYEVTADDLENVFVTNVVAPFHLITEFLKLPCTGRRSVIYVSSAASQLAAGNQVAYGPSKAAANQIILHLALACAGKDVFFHTFHPGVIPTELSQNAVGKDAFDWEDRKQNPVRDIASHMCDTWVLTFDVAKVPGDWAVWLASPEADWLSGRFTWAEWDVDELLTLKERAEKDPMFLTTSVYV